jgi:SAM-dependent methyltransferase
MFNPPSFKNFAYTVSAQNRKKKYAQFLSLLQPAKNDTILDVGVNNEEYSPTDNFLEKHYSYPENITAVTMGDVQTFAKRYPNIRSVVADGRRLPFQDESFDIGYSNAVIEHVGKEEDQIAFVRELYRTTKRSYLTTPNRFFPIEVHTRVPLLHLILSKKNFDRFLNWIGKSWATGDYMHLLSEKNLRCILEKAGVREYAITKNRLLCWTITFTVTWKKTLH